MTNTLQQLALDIKDWATELGFQQVGITDTDLAPEEPRLQEWLSNGYQADMGWMADHGNKRTRPHELLPGTCRVISVRMNYLPEGSEPIEILKSSDRAYIARYALGRDYHKLIRKRLSQLAKRIEQAVAAMEPTLTANQRPFVDSAPVLERPLAAKAGLGWIGKHTLLLNEEAGSWFFLGEILTNVPLPLTATPVANQCGDCQACLKVCPTDAFPKPYQLDARRCISFLTIENKGAIPLEFREPMGNRVFGCDDCQAICPWNKQAPNTNEMDFSPRHQLDCEELIELFLWQEEEFMKKTEGSPIRRIGYEGWLRNLSVGLGNATDQAPDVRERIITALQQKRPDTSELVQEHIDWALLQQTNPNHRRKRKIKNTSTNQP
ncbi:MAG: tRNA epoxyqueuosine(34) reductase QueG [Candidatus Pelagadaptatus aseana]|uniref:tRNA epoxyqueuosine(34) reductase QueG n=1 Tax=Candidatus Pelagadaptatus aseana TaxID=3120508 RepID=UPI0039B1FF43